jgi:hypothetical protein
MLRVKKMVNFWGENTMVGKENKANKKRSAPNPKATKAFV